MKNQQKQEKKKQNIFEKEIERESESIFMRNGKKSYILANYINYILKTLIVFGIALTISLLIRTFFNLSPSWTFVFIFLILISITPITKHINFKIGFVIQDKYDEFLQRQVKRWQKK